VLVVAVSGEGVGNEFLLEEQLALYGHIHTLCVCGSCAGYNHMIENNNFQVAFMVTLSLALSTRNLHDDGGNFQLTSIFIPL
jgi:hypothetical protein